MGSSAAIALLPRGCRQGWRPEAQILHSVDASQRGHAQADTIAGYIAGGAGAAKKIVPRVETVKSAHLRRRTMLGNTSRDLMWGNATRQSRERLLLGLWSRSCSV